MYELLEQGLYLVLHTCTLMTDMAALIKQCNVYVTADVCIVEYL